MCKFQNDMVWNEELCKELVLNKRFSRKTMRNEDGDDVGFVFFFRDDNGNMLAVPVFDGQEMQYGGTMYVDYVDKNRTKWYKVRAAVDLTDDVNMATFAFLRQPAEPAPATTRRGRRNS